VNKQDMNALCTNAAGIDRQQEVAYKQVLIVTLMTHEVREASVDTELNWRGVRAKCTSQKSSMISAVANSF
jgi:hypothetical protein